MCVQNLKNLFLPQMDARADDDDDDDDDEWKVLTVIVTMIVLMMLPMAKVMTCNNHKLLFPHVPFVIVAQSPPMRMAQ